MSKFHRLVEDQVPRLRRYARALTRDGTRADDLVQDTLVRGLAKAHLWQAGTDIRAWLFTIMHNQYVNDVRRSLREAATVDVDQVASTLVATTDPTASRQLCELDQALGQLSKRQREVVLLVGLEGMSYDEAAKILRVPIGTIRSRLGRAREALRTLMGINEDFEFPRRVARRGPASRAASRPNSQSSLQSRDRHASARHLEASWIGGSLRRRRVRLQWQCLVEQ